MTKTLKSLAVAAGLAFAASSASAATVVPGAYDANLDIGDNFLVELDAVSGDTYTGASLSFVVMEDSYISFSWTLNPNVAVTAAASVNGSAPAPFALIPSPALWDGKFLAGTTIDFTFGGAVTTLTNLDVIVDVGKIPVPAAGFLLLGGLGALVAGRRKKA